MAVNQVTLDFYPPRWKPRLTPLADAFTDRGEQVHFVDSVPMAFANAPVVATSALTNWLVEQGFAPISSAPTSSGHFSTFGRGKVRSIFGVETEIDMGVNDEAGEVTSVSCRFTLPKGASPPVADWSTFTETMCARFELRLGTSENAPCSAAEFTAAVFENRFYHEFAAQFGWNGPSS